MKKPKILRPEIDVEYIGIKGFFAALYAVCSVGIKKAHVDCHIAAFNVQSHGFDGGKIKRFYFYVIPKYKFKRVSELSESEGVDDAEPPEN